MAGSHAQRALGKLNHLLEAGAPADDGRLLQRFVRDRDQEAFAQLVTRHGPLVLGVCRRVLHDLHEAEDVFQATFLVLARKAAGIRKPESLSCFLHGVAYRLALRARLEADRRRQRERHIVPSEPTEEPDLSWREVRALIDEELLRLPERLRLPLVLCYLEGQTQDEAARRLGWPRGTLKRRLECGRDRLRIRLTRRGVTLGVGLFAAAMTQSSMRGAVPSALRSDAVRAALLFTSGEASITPASPAELLAHASLQSTSVLKLQWLGVLLLVLGGVATVGLVGGHAPADAPPQPKANAPHPTEAKRVQMDRHGDALPEGAMARLGTVRLRHNYTPTDAAFTPDGKTVIVGDTGGNIVFWDVATANEIRKLQDDRNGIFALALSADGKTLAAGANKNLLLWDVATGKLLSQTEVTNETIRQLLFTPDGKTLAIQDATDTILLWDTLGGKKRHELKGHKGPLARMALSPDGQTLASGSWQDGNIRLWDIAAGKEKFHFPAHQKDVLILAYSPDGKTLVSFGNSESNALADFFSPLVRTRTAGICFWDAATGKKLREAPLPPSASANSFAYFPDGKTMAVLDYESKIRVYDTQAGKLLREYDAPPRTMTQVLIAADGKTLATVWGGSNTLDLWDATRGKLLHPFAGHRHPIFSLAFSADGATLFSTGGLRDEPVYQWRTDTGELRGQWGDKPKWPPGLPNRASRLALSPDGKLLAADSYDSAIRLWDAASGEEVRTCRGHTGAIMSLAWSADSRTLLSSSFWDDPTIRLWDVDSGKQRHLIRVKQDRPGDVVLSPDGHCVAAGGFQGGLVRRWDATSGKELPALTTLQGMAYALAFSPDGSVLASGSLNGGIQLWDAKTGLPRHTWEARSAGVLKLAFGRDGRTLVSCHGDGKVRLWEIATGQELACFSGHRGAVRSVAIARDGRRVASGSDDTTILVWDATGGAQPQAPLPEERLQALWIDLGGKDARQAYRAMWQLALCPRQTLPFFSERLTPATPLDEKQRTRFDRFLADLDSEQFAIRQRAEDELNKMGSRIEPALHQALERKPSLEVRRRIEKIREKLANGRLQAARALEAMERMNTPEARQLLDSLAKGEPEAWLTQQARLVRARMEH
jgi:RNA polymerase sigma factor (sigma-70 family)